MTFDLQLPDPTERVDACICCRGRDLRDDARFARLLALPARYGVSQCRTCGLRWLNPRPSASAYAELYTNRNYFDGPNSVESFSALSQSRRSYFRARIRRIERYFPRTPRLRILDVGAATGEFVREALERGHAASGLELSEDARRSAMENFGINLIASPLETIDGNRRFDVIHMNHVFEHLPDPMQALTACSRLLDANGLLILEVPQQIDNDMDRLKRLLGMERTNGFTPYSLHHTYFFTPETIERLLGTAGFEVAYLATANSARTPLRPFTPRNLVLRIFLWLADKVHRGGNIIEVHAQNVAATGARNR